MAGQTEKWSVITGHRPLFAVLLGTMKIRSRFRHGHIYGKYKKCLSTMMLICINPLQPGVAYLYPLKT